MNSGRRRFIAVILYILIGALQYGYHIAALNAVQLALICKVPPLELALPISSTAHCLKISLNIFGFISAAFTVGGLFSALVAGSLCESKGRKAVTVYAAALVGAGSLLFSVGSSTSILVLSRFLVGLGCGFSTVVIPLYLGEVSPAEVRGAIITLNQLSIGFGIFLASLASPLAIPGTNSWRIVPALSVGLAAFQLAASFFMIESPKWSESKGRLPSSPVVERNEEATDFSDHDPLLLPSAFKNVASTEQLSIGDVIVSTDIDVAHGFRVVVASQFFQQLGGINAVLYYSTAILSNLIPGSSQTVGLLVSVVNLGCLAFPILLIERMGRKSLLLTSLALMSLFSFALGYGVNANAGLISSIAILAFVAAFSIGLGPVPFILLAEVPPPSSRSATASIGLATNWGLNILIALFFLPVRDMLSSTGGGGQGNVFILFGLCSAVGTVVMGRLL